MIRRLFLLVALAALVACDPPAKAPAPSANRTAIAVPVASETVRVALPVAPPTLARECEVSDRSLDMLVAFEVGSRAAYETRWHRLIVPSKLSGVTGGIGYDYGHQHAEVIRLDWKLHEAVERLAGTAGLTGARAKAALPGLADVSIPWSLARKVFDGTSVIEYCRRARRAFGPEAWDAATDDVRGGLLSLVYNRGASMSGASRLEMRVIRDTCLPARDWPCVARQVRAMSRLWAGTPEGNGLIRRRNEEADLIEGRPS